MADRDSNCSFLRQHAALKLTYCCPCLAACTSASPFTLFVLWSMHTSFAACGSLFK